MPNPRLATDEDVDRVATELAAAGRNVTCRAVLSALGVGSMTSIASSLKRWRQKQAAKSTPAADVQLPPAIELAMRSAMGELWKAAQAESRAVVDATRAQSAAAIAEAEADGERYIAELAEVNDELLAARATIDQLKFTSDSVAAAAESQRVAYAASEARAQVLGEQLASVRRDLDDERGRRNTAEARADEAQRVLDAVRVAHAEDLARLLTGAAGGPAGRKRAGPAEGGPR